MLKPHMRMLMLMEGLVNYDVNVVKVIYIYIFMSNYVENVFIEDNRPRERTFLNDAILVIQQKLLLFAYYKLTRKCASEITWNQLHKVRL